MLKENEFYSKELIKIVEEQKETIKELENYNNINNNKNYKKGEKSSDYYISINQRYNNVENNQFNGEIINHTDGKDISNNMVLPNIYNNNEEIIQVNDSNILKNNAEDKINLENLDLGLNSNEEKNKNKINEFKNLVDDLYNNASN